jgi:hypothetical protein
LQSGYCISLHRWHFKTATVSETLSYSRKSFSGWESLMSLRNPVYTSYFAFIILFCVLPAGCGYDEIGTIYPVSGRLLQDEKPLKIKTGYVILKPDVEKGNGTKFEPAGTIDSEGRYVIYTKDRSGAPPGWYKVIVAASGEAENPKPDQSKMRPLSKSLLSQRYSQQKTTPLSIEVVGSPSAGAYDLNVED